MMMIYNLKRRLAKARAELAAASRALAPKHKGGEWERYRAALQACRTLERELARAQGEECAVAIDWPARWDTGAPMPHVVSSGSHTCLIYLLSDPDPDWDGTYVTMVDPSAGDKERLAIVEFDRCRIYKFGGPNDEVISGYPLYGKGLESYGAHIVERSRWIAEQQQINSVHRQYNPQSWVEYKHYVLLFHDEIFECIAVGHSIEQRQCTFAEALSVCSQKSLR